jgi:hypothetical protein
MKSTAARFARYGVGLLGLVSLGWILAGHAAPPYQHGMPTDWTHRHVIFSQPRSAKQLAQVSRNPRYWQQWVRNNVAPVLATSVTDSAIAVFHGTRSKVKPKIKRDWSEDMGSGASMGAGQFAAKYSFSLTTATCSNVANPDYTVFSTRLQSSGTTASIVAFDNLYSGCGSFGSVPTTYWAYDTTAATVPGTIKTSPVISLDGSQISFVQTDGINHGTVVLLKWKANDGTLASPSAPALQSAANYAGCTAPCMTTFDLRTGSNVQTDDITSSVYYDYSGDVAWVGDSAGLLHKFHPFFLGIPAEIRASPWPKLVNAGTALSSPVYDQFSNSVFTGDGGGFVERTDATTGAATVSGQVEFGTGLFSGPILDQTSGNVYVFASNDGTSNCASNPCSAVFQFSTTFGAGASGSEAQVGASSGTPHPLYEGGFDSAYFSSPDATGSLYVCGNTGLNPTLFRVPINGGVMAVAGTAISLSAPSSTSGCSPVTDVPNPNAPGGSEERLFVSPQDNGRPTLCGGHGCLVSIVDSPWKASTAYVVGQEILVRHIPSGTLHTEVVIIAGMSSTSPPATWTNSFGATVVDGGVTWFDQGVLTTVPLPTWVATNIYTPPSRIVDSNGSIEFETSLAGTSGGAEPTWATTVGATTIDGGVTWQNAGALPVAALPATGGTSGVISDNTVGAGTLAGASQVYFSTLGNQLCATSGGTGGCAVQASQSALQ